jgi:soluble P-type ATPase
MLRIPIPGADDLLLEHLVLDFNGTLARDGHLLPEVAPRLARLAAQLKVHVLTGDIFGTVRDELCAVPCTVTVLAPEDQSAAKLRHVQQLGARHCACVGNGRNDRLMLQEAALSIAVIQAEGAHPATMTAADVAVTHPCDALDLLLHPQRLAATLRT